MSSPNKDQIRENTLEKNESYVKGFEYKKGKASLNFTLNLKDVEAAKKMVEVLRKAADDVEKTIDNLNHFPLP